MNRATSLVRMGEIMEVNRIRSAASCLSLWITFIHDWARFSKKLLNWNPFVIIRSPVRLNMVLRSMYPNRCAGATGWMMSMSPKRIRSMVSVRFLRASFFIQSTPGNFNGISASPSPPVPQFCITCLALRVAGEELQHEGRMRKCVCGGFTPEGRIHYRSFWVRRLTTTTAMVLKINAGTSS